ncbi:hypothetical protein FIBSPDRAFT_868815 [Athelia psychrophila]|uniref:Uncharacterized protein n=1 Tax=Athelia psychrophila TaxID=1759441 RepID=A0A166CS21_9AGAM|nr:hypothetical protein FIBSPDRAFT_868815 [Fibularhizoctonia sp. CBS 109695]
MPLRNACSTGPARYKYINCVPWILGHVQDCHGTSRAMQSVRIGYSARRNRREEDYQRLRDLVDLVELADEDDSLQDSWSSDDDEEGGGRWSEEWGDVEWGAI